MHYFSILLWHLTMCKFIIVKVLPDKLVCLEIPEPLVFLVLMAAMEQMVIFLLIFLLHAEIIPKNKLAFLKNVWIFFFESEIIVENRIDVLLLFIYLLYYEWTKGPRGIPGLAGVDGPRGFPGYEGGKGEKGTNNIFYFIIFKRYLRLIFFLKSYQRVK